MLKQETASLEQKAIAERAAVEDAAAQQRMADLVYTQNPTRLRLQHLTSSGNSFPRTKLYQ